MYKSFAMHSLDFNIFPSSERWYWREHGPEIARRYGPWITRCESWLPPHQPEGAEALGFMNWRSTVCHWREIPKAGHQGDLAFSSPIKMARVCSALMPPQPTEDFLGGDQRSGEKSVLRFVHFLRYPNGVDKEEADRFYVETFAQEAKNQKHLHRFFSTRTASLDIMLPGVWAPDDLARMRPDSSHDWDRVSEMWYETYDEWREDVITAPPAYTKPAWAMCDSFSFLKPGENFVFSLLLERPNDDFMQSKISYL